MPLLELEHVDIRYRAGSEPAVRDVSLTLDHGERVGIVGESGSGKSTLVAAVLRSLPKGAAVDGRITLDGRDLAGVPPAEFRRLRSVEVARIPQDPLASLNPVIRIGVQLDDVIRAHRRLPAADRRRLAVDALAAVGIPAPESKLRSYPHELSGGMRQRVLIAMALVNEPRLLIADEPTTALDVTVQAQIIDLLRHRLDHEGMSMLLITHDIGVVVELCERIVVMRRGGIIEEGRTAEIMRDPKHPYTRSLFAAASAMPVGRRREGAA
ncbi:ABC transporter ATP-binding protein [Agromyces mediolanus]|uniref:ABC transporter ATP-binding protein n=1 Tax=Agromyces mediolanus TaxID=41986 RepID=UPI0020420CD0|nr:ABC transporter ATP-binding protein [Agromyces mediolanus]MCM3658708.1 ABC transporter ATP-binding protein [Agromyces mediolanus]